MAKHVVWRNMKRDYFARIDDGDEFYIGTRVSYGGRIGLQNGKPRSGLCLPRRRIFALPMASGPTSSSRPGSAKANRLISA